MHGIGGVIALIEIECFESWNPLRRTGNRICLGLPVDGCTFLDRGPISSRSTRNQSYAEDQRHRTESPSRPGMDIHLYDTPCVCQDKLGNKNERSQRAKQSNVSPFLWTGDLGSTYVFAWC